MDLDPPAGIIGRAEDLVHKVLIVLWRYPCRADADRDFSSGQINGLHFFQCLHIGGIDLRIPLGLPPRFPQLLPDIPGEILVRGQVFCLAIAGAGFILRIEEYYAAKVITDFLFGPIAQLHHVIHIHLCFFSQ